MAVRKSATENGQVRVSGLPTTIKAGQVLFEYEDEQFRTVDVSGGSFSDPFAPFDARVYRFRVSS